MDEKATTVVVDLQEVFDNSPQQNAAPLLHDILLSKTVTNALTEPDKIAYPVYNGKSTIVVK